MKKREHGIKGQLNTYILDVNSNVTGYGQHDRVVAFQPDYEGLYCRIDHRGLGMPTVEQVLKVARSLPNDIKGKWAFDKTRSIIEYQSTLGDCSDIYFTRKGV